jgi:hypothetical protein
LQRRVLQFQLVHHNVAVTDDAIEQALPPMTTPDHVNARGFSEKLPPTCKPSNPPMYHHNVTFLRPVFVYGSYQSLFLFDRGRKRRERNV